MWTFLESIFGTMADYKFGTDQGEENEQDGSKRFDPGGAATTTAGALRLCNKQI